ncbi:unnamed protein product [Trichobilharzia regenti]|nr:unnamed protein product [Trichobilharzia regenti]
MEAELPVNINPPTRTEVLDAIKMLKSGKAAGSDEIPAEALKMDPWTTADLMTPLLQKVWKEGKVPEDWKKRCGESSLLADWLTLNCVNV